MVQDPELPPAGLSSYSTLVKSLHGVSCLCRAFDCRLSLGNRNTNGGAKSCTYALRAGEVSLSPHVMPRTDLSPTLAMLVWTSESSASRYPPLDGIENMSPSIPTPKMDLSYLAPSFLCSGHEEEDSDNLQLSSASQAPITPLYYTEVLKEDKDCPSPVPGSSPQPTTRLLS